MTTNQNTEPLDLTQCGVAHKPEIHAGYPGSGLARCGAPIGAITVAPGEEFTCRKCGEVYVGDDKCPQCGAFERTEWLGEDRRGTNNGWRCVECKHTWYTPTRTA